MATYALDKDLGPIALQKGIVCVMSLVSSVNHDSRLLAMVHKFEEKSRDAAQRSVVAQLLENAGIHDYSIVDRLRRPPQSSPRTQHQGYSSPSLQR